MAPNPVGDELDVGGPAPAQRRNEYREPVLAVPNDRPVHLHLLRKYSRAVGIADEISADRDVEQDEERALKLGRAVDAARNVGDENQNMREPPWLHCMRLAAIRAGPESPG